MVVYELQLHGGIEMPAPKKDGPTSKKENRRTMIIDVKTSDALKKLSHEVYGNSGVETLAYAVRFAALPENREDLMTYIKTHHWSGEVTQRIVDVIQQAEKAPPRGLSLFDKVKGDLPNPKETAAERLARQSKLEARREAQREKFNNARVEVITAIIDRTDFTEDN